MKKYRAAIYVLTLLFICPLQAQNKDFTYYVNTLQGTNSHYDLSKGNTYPTTAMPWGMNFWTSQTGINGDGWIYQHFKDSIRGFRQTHQCSSWTKDYGSFSLMPVSGKLVVDQYARALKFSHENERAKPHYYQVLFENGLNAEMSPTERGVFMRFRFPNDKASYIIVDAASGGSMVRIYPKEKKIVGYCRNGNHSTPENFANYFVIKFDKPFLSHGTWDGNTNKVQINSFEDLGDYVGSYVQFEKGVTVNVKIASSFISIEQAELNFKKELEELMSIEDVARLAKQEWNKQLSKIEVEGGTKKEIETFYSCFFRSMLFPRKFYEYDANNQPIYYSPYDGHIHKGYMYTDTGFWDTFRAQFPLNAILHPEMHQKYIYSLLDAYDQSDWLPTWSFPGHNAGMIGNHAASVLADAYVKGFDFDTEKALSAMFHESTNKGPYGPSNGRDGWIDYLKLGYVPHPDYRESVAKTLEYCYDDFAAMQVAKFSGNKFYENIFKRQILNYKNVYDPSTRFMRGRSRTGEWSQNFDPIEWGDPYTEASAWHYHWSVFHDIQGLIDLMGGDKNFIAKLDSVFSIPSTFKTGSYKRVIHEMSEMALSNMGQYAHGNQPIQHMIYLYNYAGEPWKTQFWSREVLDRLYNATPDGYPGDEDQGQTSSWYVISALGLYAVCPGTDQYVLSSPAFPKITINLENNNKFKIISSENTLVKRYIQKAYLNKVSYNKTWINYNSIMKGGILEYKMDEKPNKKWGTSENSRPYSYTKKSHQNNEILNK